VPGGELEGLGERDHRGHAGAGRGCGAVVLALQGPDRGVGLVVGVARGAGVGLDADRRLRGDAVVHLEARDRDGVVHRDVEEHGAAHAAAVVVGEERGELESGLRLERAGAGQQYAEEQNGEFHRRSFLRERSREMLQGLAKRELVRRELEGQATGRT
jgi:hypothetical protein